MKYELDLIKKKVVTIMDSTTDAKVATCLVDITKLANKCLDRVDQMDHNLEAIFANTRQTTIKLRMIQKIGNGNAK